MEGVRGVVHDGQQFGWHPELHNLLHDGQLRVSHRTCFPDQFIQSVGIICHDACVPTHHSKDGACHKRLIKHQEHPVAYIEGPEPPEEI